MRQSSSKAELDLIFLQADLDSLHSVKEATEKFESKESKMHILVNNAGVCIDVLPQDYLSYHSYGG